MLNLLFLVYVLHIALFNLKISHEIAKPTESKQHNIQCHFAGIDHNFVFCKITYFKALITSLPWVFCRNIQVNFYLYTKISTIYTNIYHHFMVKLSKLTGQIIKISPFFPISFMKNVHFCLEGAGNDTIGILINLFTYHIYTYNIIYNNNDIDSYYI